ncbi:MAG TPA: DUF29 domain-containing protein [Methylobacter sp.]|jgi:hypothetical protein
MINYETDFYGWTQEQAALLRAGRLSDLDIENLIEEVETMGRSEKRELESRLTGLLLHLLKWKYQEARRGRSWELSIIEQRLKFKQTLSENPGLKPHLADILARSYEFAVLYASRETKISTHVFPATCPWNLEEAIQTDFYPD